VICNVLDPNYAQINRSRLGNQEADWLHSDSSSNGRPTEPWIILLVLGAVLLVADWAAFSRRITV
jgi:extradiol dioxygenase family protein